MTKSEFNANKARRFISAFPCFGALSNFQLDALTALFCVIEIEAMKSIVTEEEIVDSIYIIVEGVAEVTRRVIQHKKPVEIPIAMLSQGEAIGLNDTGFYSHTGKRTATVTAVTEMTLLKLDLKDLYIFLKKNNLELSMYAASEKMLRMRFIKQSLPFAKLTDKRLQWLSEHVEELSIKAGTIIFNEGDEGNKCYLIHSGQVIILSKNEFGEEKQLAKLKAPVLFGEATLITHSARNATAKALEDCELLTLEHKYLSELIESETDVAHMFMSLMVDRSRPLRNPSVSIHHRQTADGQNVTILKNTAHGSYFKLSEEGYFIWQQLDGKHTMQEIVLDLAEQKNLFAPDVVAALISKLTRSDFVTNIEMLNDKSNKHDPWWMRVLSKTKFICEKRFAFGDADLWLSKTYRKFFRYLFTKSGQIVLAIVAIAGFIAFVTTTPDVLLFFSFKHTSLLLILALIPLSILEVVLHELGHAYAVKAFGREVHYIGVGWYWFAPIAFTDTSDMWLSTRKPRMLVNFAGIYVDILSAGISALLILLIPNPYVQSLLWLFALYTYIGGFRMLSPLQDMDGYYILMDWVEKPRLRQAAVIWLMSLFQKSNHKKNLLREHRAEIIYWIAASFYLLLVTGVTFVLQAFIFSILGIESMHPFLSLIFPFLVLIMSCVGIYFNIKQQID